MSPWTRDEAAKAIAGTGNPIPLAFSDGGDNNYHAASPASTAAITRDCKRLRMIVANSGIIVSLDGGVTDHVSLPPNSMDDFAVDIPKAADIRIKRYTAGTAITGLLVEVR